MVFCGEINLSFALLYVVVFLVAESFSIRSVGLLGVDWAHCFPLGCDKKSRRRRQPATVPLHFFDDLRQKG